MSDNIKGVYIDINNLVKKKERLQHSHVAFHKKDESAIILLKKINSKIKALTAYAEKKIKK